MVGHKHRFAQPRLTAVGRRGGGGLSLRTVIFFWLRTAPKDYNPATTNRHKDIGMWAPRPQRCRQKPFLSRGGRWLK